MYIFLNLIKSENGGIEIIIDLNMFDTLLWWEKHKHFNSTIFIIFELNWAGSGRDKIII